MKYWTHLFLHAVGKLISIALLIIASVSLMIGIAYFGFTHSPIATLAFFLLIAVSPFVWDIMQKEHAKQMYRQHKGNKQ